MNENEALFELVDKGVRVVFVPCLREGWLYLTGQRLLLLDEDATAETREEARQEVLAEFSA